MYGSKSRFADALRCGACGRLPGPGLAAYPSADGAALCGHCAYASGALSGRERGKYVRRHPLRAALLAVRRAIRRARR